MARGVGIQHIVDKIMRGRKSIYRAGKWRTQRSADGNAYHLYHYGTEMLRWNHAREVTGWWGGWGSVSDQEGVNAALRALGSPLRYHRDRAGGGARVNPAYRVSATVGRSINAITPPVY